MAIIAGIQGQPAELLDNAKVNSLIEYTTGNGVQLQGRTSGVAIEAGKVGESYCLSPGLHSYNGGGTETNYVYISQTVGAGVWRADFFGGVNTDTNGNFAAGAYVGFVFYLAGSTGTGNPTYNWSCSSTLPFAIGNSRSQPLGGFTNIFNVTSSTLVQVKSTITATGTVYVGGTLTLVRIA